MQLTAITAFKIYADMIGYSTLAAFILTFAAFALLSLPIQTSVYMSIGFALATFLAVTFYACVYLPFKLQK